MNLSPNPPARSSIKSLCQDNGNSIVETALVMPVFFFMMFGVVEWCLVLFGMANANFASRSALRYASLHSLSSYRATTQQDLDGIVKPLIFSYPANTVSISASTPAGNTVGSPLCVTLQLSYTLDIVGHRYNGINYSTTGCAIVVQ